jgi:hypothetical protein
MARYDEHAEFQLERRGIGKDWVEETLSDPDEVEIKGKRRSCLRCFPDRKFALRVVTPLHEPDYVITAYFDRRRTCA